MIDILETNGLEMSDPILSKDKIFVTINGTRYAYTMKDDSELDPKELVKKVIGIKKYSDGRALSFLKKHCDGSKYEVASYNKITEDEFDVDRTKEFNEIQRNVNKRINNTIYDLAHEYGCTDDYFPVQRVIDSAAAKRVRTDLANAIFAATR